MTETTGKVTNVYTVDAGGTLVAPVANGDSVIFLDDAYDFDPDGGGFDFVIDGTHYVWYYTSVDYVANTLTITPTTAVASTDDDVVVRPAAQLTWAMIDLDDGDQGVRALVPFGMRDRLATGIRDPDDQEGVTISDATGRWQILAVDDEIPNIDGGYLGSNTVDTSKVTFSAGAIGPTAPANPKVGDLWVDTGHGNQLMTWNGTAWVTAQDQAISTAQSTANGKNKVTYSTLDPGAVANAAGDLWFTYSGTIVSKQWQGLGGTSWQQVTVGNTVIANLDAGKITTGFLDVAGRLQANSITTDKMIIGSGQNWIPNPGWENGVTTPHTSTGGTAPFIVTANIRGGTYAAVVTTVSTRGIGAYGYDMTWGGPVLSTTAHMPVAQGDVIYGEFWVRDNSTGGAGQVTAYIDGISTSGARVSNTPDASTQVQVTVAGFYQRVSVRYTVPAGVAFCSLNVAAANMTVGMTYLVDDAFMAKQVEGRLLVNGALDAKMITGPILQTATGTAGVKLSGTMATSGMLIENDTSGGVIKFFGGNNSPAAPETPGSINPTLDLGVQQTPAIWFTSPLVNSVGNYFQAARIRMVSGGTYASIPFNPCVYINGPGTDICDADIEGKLWIHGSYADTTASAANVFFATDHHLARSTSLRDKKVDIIAMTKGECEAVMGIEATTFFDRGEWTRNNESTDGLRRIPGAIAEQVEEVAPLFATYDDDGLNGISYERIAVALIPIIREQREKINDLEARLARLEATLA